jgi:hypothetical protein
MGIVRSEIGKILGNFQLGLGLNFGPKSGPKKKHWHVKFSGQWLDFESLR